MIKFDDFERIQRMWDGSGLTEVMKQLDGSGVTQAMKQLESSGAAGAMKQLESSGAAGAMKQLESSGVAGAMKQLESSGATGAMKQLESSGAAGAMKQMEQYLEPQRQLQERMEQYLAPQRQLQEQVEKYLKPQIQHQEQLGNLLLPLRQYLSDPLMDSICVNEDGTLAVANEPVSVRSLEECISLITVDYEPNADFVSHFLKWLGGLRQALRIAVIYLMLPYLIAIFANLTTPIFQEWWREYSDLDPKAAKEAIAREANEVYSIEELKEHQFVHVKILHVRSYGEIADDNVIDELYLGQVVKIKQKSGRWCLVEYRDSTASETKQGWVFARHLSRFNE